MRDKDLRAEFSRLCKALGVGFETDRGLHVVSGVDMCEQFSIAARLKRLEKTLDLLMEDMSLEVLHQPAKDVLVLRKKATDGK